MSRITITLSGPDADRVYEEVVGAIEDMLEAERPDFDWSADEEDE